MAKQLLGKEVNASLNARIIADCEACKAKGVNPTMAIVRCGERPWAWRWRNSCCRRT